MTYKAKHPAAFINALSEEGTRAEVIAYLQKYWDRCRDLERALQAIADIEWQDYGPDYEEIEQAQEIAIRALEAD